MKTNEVVETLTKFNKWRRGEDYPMPNPKEIGRAIDQAIKEMEVKQKALELLRELADHQNGAPLLKYFEKYNNCMDKVYKFLKENEVCQNLDGNNQCKFMCLTGCTDGNNFYK